MGKSSKVDAKNKRDSDQEGEQKYAQEIGADDDQEMSEDYAQPGQLDSHGNLKGLVVPPGQEQVQEYDASHFSNATPAKTKHIQKAKKLKKQNASVLNAKLMKMMSPQNYDQFTLIIGDVLNPKAQELKKAMKKARDGYQMYDSFKQFKQSPAYSILHKRIIDIIQSCKKKPAQSDKNSLLSQRLAAAQKLAQQLAAQKKAAQKLAQKIANQKIAAQKLAIQKQKLLIQKQKQRILTEKASIFIKKVDANKAEKSAAQKAAADKAAADRIAMADKIIAEQKAEKQRIATQKIAADKIAADKIAADKIAADKIAADKKLPSMDIQPGLQEQLLMEFQIQVIQQLLNDFRNPQKSQNMTKRWGYFKNAKTPQDKKKFLEFFKKMHVKQIQQKIKNQKTNPPPQSNNQPQSNPPQTGNQPPTPPPKTQLAYCTECSKGQITVINGVMTKLSRTINKKAVDVGPTPMCGTCVNLIANFINVGVQKAVKKQLLTKQQGKQIDAYMNCLKSCQMQLRVKQAVIQWIPSSKIKQHSQKGYIWKITIPLGSNLGSQQWASSFTGSLGQIHILSSKFKRFYLPFHFDQYVGYYSKESMQAGSQPIAQKLKKYLNSMKDSKRGLLVYYLSICVWTALAGSKVPRWGKDAAQIRSYDDYLKIASLPDAPQPNQPEEQIDF